MTWAYVLTAGAMIALPGPDVLLLSSRALERGVWPAARTLAGTVCGYALLTLLLAAGLGAALTSSPGLHLVLRVTAVAYLLWLAARAWWSAAATGAPEPGTHRGEWRDGLLTAALNAKGLLFFVALMPPFVDPQRPAAGQLAVLGLLFCAIALVVYGTLVAVVLLLRHSVQTSGRLAGRVSALVLVAAAGFIASGAGG